MEVLSYFYYPNDKKRIWVRSNNYEYYLRHGYTIVGNYDDEGFYILNKPAEVILEVVDEEGNQLEVDCKDLILALYHKKKISAQMAKRFFDEIRAGKWRLAFDNGKNLIAFPRN